MRMSDCVQSFHQRLPVYQVQMDEWKVVAGGEDGFLHVWDRRTGNKLWELFNRYLVDSDGNHNQGGQRESVLYAAWSMRKCSLCCLVNEKVFYLLLGK